MTTTLAPNRFSFSDHSLLEVPGCATRWGKALNVPRNCRRLLKQPPSALTVPATLERPPEIREGISPLFDWQERGVRWALPRPGSLMMWVGGAGKSRAALWLALLTGGPIVWVSMGRLKPTIMREVRAVSTLKPTILDGRSASDRIENTRLAIVGWETLVAWEDPIKRLLEDGGTVLFDELHMTKNYKRDEKYVNPVTKRPDYRPIQSMSTAAANIGAVAQRRVGMTATPVGNSRADLWSQLDILESGCWGDNWNWVHRYCDAKPGEHGGLNTRGRSNNGELDSRLKEMTSIVTKKEIAEVLPGTRRQLVYLGKSEQSRPPAGVAEEMRRAAKQGAQALLEARVFEASARKRKWIAEYVAYRVKDLGHKVVVFTNRRIDTEALAEAVRGELGDKFRVWAGHGGHSNADRDNMAEAYMNTREGCCLIGTGASFGTGMNLQDTDCYLAAGLPYTWKDVGQWEWRFSRPGQLRPCDMLYLVAEGSYDEVIVDILLSKLEDVGETMGDEEAEGLASTLAGDQDDEDIMAALLSKL